MDHWPLPGSGTRESSVVRLDRCAPSSSTWTIGSRLCAKKFKAAPSPLVVRVDVPARRPALVKHAGWFVVQLRPSADVADKREDPRAELSVVWQRSDGLFLSTLVLLRDRVDVEPNPDFTAVLNAKVGLHIFQPDQLGPFVVVWVIFRLPILGHEVGECAVGYLRVEVFNVQVACALWLCGFVVVETVAIYGSIGIKSSVTVGYF